MEVVRGKEGREELKGPHPRKGDNSAQVCTNDGYRVAATIAEGYCTPMACVIKVLVSK